LAGGTKASTQSEVQGERESEANAEGEIREESAENSLKEVTEEDWQKAVRGKGEVISSHPNESKGDTTGAMSAAAWERGMGEEPREAVLGLNYHD